MTAVAAGGTDAATSAGYGLSNMAAGAAAGDDDSAAAAGVDALRSIISSGGDDQSTVDVSIRARAIDALADSAINAVAALPELTALLGKETRLFAPFYTTYKRSFYQDRLGTNIGKEHSKRDAFLQGMRTTIPGAALPRRLGSLHRCVRGSPVSGFLVVHLPRQAWDVRTERLASFYKHSGVLLSLCAGAIGGHGHCSCVPAG